MKGGAIPQGEKWLESLPLIDPENPVEGLGVFTGFVNDVENLVFKIHREEGVYYLSAVYEQVGEGYWYFDTETDTFEHAGTSGSGWASSIIEQAGLGDVFTPGQGEQVLAITKGQVLYKAEPA